MAAAGSVSDGRVGAFEVRLRHAPARELSDAELRVGAERGFVSAEVFASEVARRSGEARARLRGSMERVGSARWLG